MGFDRPLALLSLLLLPALVAGYVVARRRRPRYAVRYTIIDTSRSMLSPAIADTTGGEYFAARSARALSAAYEDLGSRLGRAERRTEGHVRLPRPRRRRARHGGGAVPPPGARPPVVLARASEQARVD